MWDEYIEQAVNLNNAKEVQAIRAFLLPFDLSFDSGMVDYTIALYQQDKIAATGSLSRYVLRNIAVNESLQGAGLTGKIVTHLLDIAVERGYYHAFLFTRPKNIHFFTQLGFTLLSQVKQAALLETGLPAILQYQQEMRNQAALLPSGQRAVLVMNCNPFTKGHRH